MAAKEMVLQFSGKLKKNIHMSHVREHFAGCRLCYERKAKRTTCRIIKASDAIAFLRDKAKNATRIMKSSQILYLCVRWRIVG